VNKQQRTNDAHDIRNVQPQRVLDAEQLLGQRGVEDAPVVRVDGHWVAARDPLGQVRVLRVSGVAQGDQIGGGAHLDGDGLLLRQQLQHLQYGKKYNRLSHLCHDCNKCWRRSVPGPDGVVVGEARVPSCPACVPKRHNSSAGANQTSAANIRTATAE
jgi:hypothetical protein